MTLQSLLEDLAPLGERDEDDYCPIPIKRLCSETDAAVLILFDANVFKEISRHSSEPVWFPKATLRAFEGEVYFKISFAKQKGLNA